MWALNTMYKVFIVACLLATCTSEDRVTYDGYTVYRLYPKTDEHRDILMRLESYPSFDFWTDVNRKNLPVDIMVKPEWKNLFISNARWFGLVPEVFIEDVGKLIKNQTVQVNRLKGRMEFDRYYRLNDIHSWLHDLERSFPNIVKVVVAGKSTQDRNIKGVKISFKPSKPIFFIECGIHAREWITPTTCNFIINELLTSQDLTIRTMAESFEWHIFPSINPDGYEHTHNFNRLWRKNRKLYGICVGVDLNRNWDNHWLEQGSSSNPCSDVHAGPNPFSEVESSTFSKYIRSVAPNMVAYVAFHSYSQLFMLPFGYTTDRLDNYGEMMDVANKSVEALAKRYGTQYKAGNIGEIIYLASGSSSDWVKAEFKTPVVVTYELRDTGDYGFLLPADQITPNGLEVMDSLIAMTKTAEKYGYFKLG